MLNSPIAGGMRLIVLGFLAFAVGAILFGELTSAGDGEYELQSRVMIYPAAYQLAKIPGGTSLHMAMVHDVLLERYLRHGEAWYMRRNELSRAILAEKGAPTDPAGSADLDVRRLDAMDDLAVGLEFLHHSDEAIQVMRDKLQALPPIVLPPPFVSTTSIPYDMELEEAGRIAAAGKLSVEMHQHYTAYANLGTSLIHGALSRALAGDIAARRQLAEGLADIDQSIAINPAAHFGREIWQAVAVRHFLASFSNPGLLARFDMVGNSLSDVPWRGHYDARDGLPLPAATLEAEASLEKRVALRMRIFRTGINGEWLKIVGGQPQSPAHFDEPVLALMGMWMFGGGPNPHSAMALADIANQIGQLEIAWDGYERALEMAAGFSADPATREALSKHCRDQQALIAAIESPNDPNGWTTATRRRHAGELVWARHYQDDYHAWEASQIVAGKPLDAPDFYDGFFRSHPPIASPIGHSDEIGTRIYTSGALSTLLPGGLLLGGIFMFLEAVAARRRTTRCTKRFI